MKTIIKDPVAQVTVSSGSMYLLDKGKKSVKIVPVSVLSAPKDAPTKKNHTITIHMLIETVIMIPNIT